MDGERVVGLRLAGRWGGGGYEPRVGVGGGSPSVSDAEGHQESGG